MNLARYFIHTITHWPTEPNGFGGFTYGAPVTYNARWEDKREKYLNKGGEEVISRAVVYMSEDLDIDDYIALGDHSAVDDPTTVDSFLIGGIGSSPDLRGLNYLRKVFL